MAEPQTALRAEGLQKHFGGLTAVADVSRSRNGKDRIIVDLNKLCRRVVFFHPGCGALFTSVINHNYFGVRLLEH